MDQTLRKRCHEPEALPDSVDVREPKRFHGEETNEFLDLLQLDQTLADEEEECTLSEELVNGVMRSLEEEIAGTYSTSYPSSNSGENSAACDICCSHEGQILGSDTGIDLSYLLEASDDELGIPPSPILIELCPSRKETTEDLPENPNFKSLGEGWHFELDDFENYQQFALYENFSDAILLEDYMSRDFVSQGMLFDGDFSTTWQLETASGM